MVRLSGKYSPSRDTKKWCWRVELGVVLRGVLHLLRLALEALEDDVQDAVGVEVEVADEGLDHLDHVGGADLERGAVGQEGVQFVPCRGPG